MITYIAVNTKNGKFYIGSTNNFERRKKQHLGNKSSTPFHNALRKEPHKFEWETWEDDFDNPVLEQALLDMWFGKECCYNLNPSADRPPILTGHKFRDETVSKRSAKRRGKTVPSLKGKPLSRDHKEKISNSCKGREGMKGERNPRAKLTDKQRQEIREKYVPQGPGNGKGNASALAKEYGVTRKNIHDVIGRVKTSNVG